MSRVVLIIMLSKVTQTYRVFSLSVGVLPRLQVLPPFILYDIYESIGARIVSAGGRVEDVKIIPFVSSSVILSHVQALRFIYGAPDNIPTSTLLMSYVTQIYFERDIRFGNINNSNSTCSHVWKTAWSFCSVNGDSIILICFKWIKI